MTMQRWDPFRELRRMEERMNRMWKGDWQDEGWSMPVDVIESQDKVTVRASIPGINPDDLKVTYENGTLTIRGESAQEREEQEGDYLVRERRSGSMYRVVSLPDSVDVEGADSICENGVLTITFPKAEEKKARQLKIKGKGTLKAVEGGETGEETSRRQAA